MNSELTTPPATRHLKDDDKERGDAKSTTVAHYELHDRAPSQRTHDLARRVLSLLALRNETVAVAESLTGGLVLAALTDVPGASRQVVGGVVAYTDAAKTALLAVPRVGVLEGPGAPGAVSPECAAAMAVGVLRAVAVDASSGGADWGLATTGFAGAMAAASATATSAAVPSTDPDGLVFLHVARRRRRQRQEHSERQSGQRGGEDVPGANGETPGDDGKTRASPMSAAGWPRRLDLRGLTRWGNRAAAVDAALELLVQALEDAATAAEDNDGDGEMRTVRGDVNWGGYGTRSFD